MKNAREESLHVAVGRVFEMTLATAEALDDASALCRDALRRVSREARATDYDYMWAVHTQQLLATMSVHKFRHTMRDAMVEGRAAIWPAHDYD